MLDPPIASRALEGPAELAPELFRRAAGGVAEVGVEASRHDQLVAFEDAGHELIERRAACLDPPGHRRVARREPGSERSGNLAGARLAHVDDDLLGRELHRGGERLDRAQAEADRFRRNRDPALDGDVPDAALSLAPLASSQERLEEIDGVDLVGSRAEVDREGVRANGERAADRDSLAPDLQNGVA